MIFSSPIFLFLFLPIFLIVYTVLPFKNLVFLAFSLLFYSWGEPIYVFLMIGVIGMNYLLGLSLVGRQKSRQQATVALAVCLNIGILGYFKYFGFFMQNLNALIGEFGFTPLVFDTPSLPLGISFFVFQAVTYVVDVYRGDSKAEKNPLNIALYISMFPQLVAGPIVRFQQISDAIHERRQTLDEIYAGVRLFIIGLAKKVLIADVIAVPCNIIFSAPGGSLPTATAWMGALCFTLQIYYDFSGYTDMARGLGKVVGFQFPENFNYPYTAKSIQDFWRRWHITLSTWFRDYVYIPLGGNRHGKSKTLRNLLIVFVLTGAWHGADWKFILWGAIHGGFLLFERLLGKKLLQRLPVVVQHGYSLLVVIVAWVFFRGDSLGNATAMIGAMIGMSTPDYLSYSIMRFASPYVVATLAVGTLLAFNSNVLLERCVEKLSVPYFKEGNAVVSHALYLGVLFVCMTAIAGQSHTAFIYFRF
jgi:Predicted membrane protein involved in D-alanine export